MKIKPTDFEESCITWAIAILNGEFSGLKEGFHPRFKPPENGSAGPYSLDLEDFGAIDEIDPFSTWLSVATQQSIRRVQPPLTNLVDSWIEANYSLARWNRREEFVAAIQNRQVYVYQDTFDRKDHRVRIAFYLSEEETPGELAAWLFTQLITGPYARGIGKCKSDHCKRYCRRNRSKEFFCDPKCNRRSSSKLSKKKMRVAEREMKDETIRKAIKVRPRRRTESIKAWKEEITRRVNKRLFALEEEPLAVKSITQYLKRVGIPGELE